MMIFGEPASCTVNRFTGAVLTSYAEATIYIKCKDGEFRDVAEATVKVHQQTESFDEIIAFRMRMK